MSTQGEDGSHDEPSRPPRTAPPGGLGTGANEILVEKIGHCRRYLSAASKSTLIAITIELGYDSTTIPGGSASADDRVAWMLSNTQAGRTAKDSEEQLEKLYRAVLRHEGARRKVRAGVTFFFVAALVPIVFYLLSRDDRNPNRRERSELAQTDIDAINRLIGYLTSKSHPTPGTTKCGAALIKQNKIITSQHCAKDRERLTFIDGHAEGHEESVYSKRINVANDRLTVVTLAVPINARPLIPADSLLSFNSPARFPIPETGETTLVKMRVLTDGENPFKARAEVEATSPSQCDGLPLLQNPNTGVYILAGIGLGGSSCDPAEFAAFTALVMLEYENLDNGGSDASDDDASDGDASDGDASDGDASDGDASDGDASDGDASDGDASDNPYIMIYHDARRAVCAGQPVKNGGLIVRPKSPVVTCLYQCNGRGDPIYKTNTFSSTRTSWRMSKCAK